MEETTISKPISWLPKPCLPTVVQRTEVGRIPVFVCPFCLGGHRCQSLMKTALRFPHLQGTEVSTSPSAFGIAVISLPHFPMFSDLVLSFSRAICLSIFAVAVAFLGGIVLFAELQVCCFSHGYAHALDGCNEGIISCGRLLLHRFLDVLEEIRHVHFQCVFVFSLACSVLRI